jgi:hypothetical protein
MATDAPKKRSLDSERASALSKRGWQRMTPVERRARVLRMRIAGSLHAQQELDELLRAQECTPSAVSSALSDETA